MQYKTTATFSGRRADTGEDVSEPVEVVISTAMKDSARNRQAFEALAWKALRELRPDWVPADHSEGHLFLPAQGLWKIRPIVTLSGNYEKISMPRAAEKSALEKSILRVAKEAGLDADAVIARMQEIMAVSQPAQGDLDAGPPCNTNLTVHYRDGGNNKTYLPAVVSGLITQSHMDAIRSCLDDGEYFIAHQVGLPTPSENFRRYDGYPTEDNDHVYSTLFDDSTLPEELHTNAKPTLDMSIDELVEMFRNVKSWDVAPEWARLKALPPLPKPARKPAPK